MRTRGVLILGLAYWLVGCGPELDRTPQELEFSSATQRKFLQVEARYKFTGVSNRGQTQLAWKLNVLIDDVEDAPPLIYTGKPSEIRKDDLCLAFDYNFVDSDGFALARRTITVPVKVGVQRRWEGQQWISTVAATRSVKIVGELRLYWTISCPLRLRPALPSP